jgi:histidine triad (HIT) family protein
MKTSFKYEDELVVAFDDIAPKAPVHVLIVPKKHIVSTATLEDGDEQIAGHMIRTAQKIAEQLSIAEKGYRLVFNTRNHGGQVVDHIHLHLLGGQRLGSMV